MIRLGLKSEPYWLDLLPGVRIKVRPFGTALFFAAQSAMVRVDTKGEPAPVSPDAVDALMEIWQAAAAFERIYARPISEIETEKND